MVASNVFEGVGILMLVPLLTVAQVFDDAAADGGAGGQVARAFDVVGLPQTLSVVLALFVALVCARETVLRWQVKASDKLDQGFLLFLREELYRAVTRARWLFLTRIRSSDVLQVLTADLARVGAGTQHLI